MVFSSQILLLISNFKENDKSVDVSQEKGMHVEKATLKNCFNFKIIT